jgi:deazaflavin-dependent oxidoreductase (nitroreductase family)
VDDFAAVDFCYLTTTGRSTRRLHTVEIWFGLRDGSVYMLSGGGHRSDWVKNIRARPAVEVRIRDRTFPGNARLVDDEDEDAMVRRLLASKYQRWSEGRPLSSWARTAVPVAVDLQVGD